MDRVQLSTAKNTRVIRGKEVLEHNVRYFKEAEVKN